MAHEVELTDANFEQEVLKSETPVLVDFWAEWCGPCRMIASVVGELASEYAGKIKVGKVNVDNSQKTAAAYAIRSIPTLLLFKEGKLMNQLVGVQPKEKIAEAIKKAL